MRVDLPAILPLFCLGCRTRSDRGHEVYTLELERILARDGDDVREGILRCVQCARRYPIVNGIPVLVADLGAHFTRELVGLTDPDLAPELAALLALGGPDDAPLSRLAELLSIYLDGHWGDRASPPPDGPGARSGPDLVHSRVAETSQTPVAAALELGCSVGRGLHELARNAELCVGVDSSLAALRRARRLLAGKPLGYARRTVGRHYRPVTIAAPEPRRVELICADAQDPPVPPARFDRVLALNLLDVVHDPQAVLNVAAGVTRPGGELHLTSPYAWATGFVGEEHRLGGVDPAAHVAGWLRKAGWTLLEERDLAWPLRRDARSAIVYSVHYLRVRKALLR